MAQDPHINPASGVWDDNYYAATHPAGQSSGGGGGGMSADDIINAAKKVQEFQVQANQPAIQTMQASKAPLQQRYSDLISNIKGSQQVAENQQTVTTNNILGARGITGSSGLAQQELTNALLPVRTQYTGMLNNATGQENQDLAAIDQAIAQLQAGNPAAAVSSASGIQNAIAQLNLAQQQQAFNQRYIPIAGYGIYDTTKNNLLGGYSASGLGASGGQIVGTY